VQFNPVIKAEFTASLLFSVTWSNRKFYNVMLKKHLWLLSMLKKVFYIFISGFF